MLLLLGAGRETAIAVALIGNLGRQAVQLNKALCGGLVEGIAGVIGGKIKGLQRLARAAPGHRGGAGVHA